MRISMARKWTLILLGIICVFGVSSALRLPLTNAALAAETREAEPNDTDETAQVLNAIGLNNPVNARINQPGDVDWYRFEAVAGRTYVVELFNVSSSLDQGEVFYTCNGRRAYYRGLALFAYDGLDRDVLAAACSSNAGGNTLVSLAFTARNSGAVNLLVYANISRVQGSYQLRVLPKYGEPGAAWDAKTLEPNNSEATAALVQVGRENAITAQIEERDSRYTTYTGDIDWYRFNAVAGRTYVVELFNVSNSLGQGTLFYTCNGERLYYRGLALLAFDTVNKSQIAASCNPNNGGNTLVSIAFKAEHTGPITLLVYPNISTTIGSYSLRVLPKYDEEGASWDTTTFEPNNHQDSAAPISIGRGNSIRANIEERNSIYATNSGDIDWYRFSAIQGQRYTIELSNVSTSLSQGSLFYTCHGTRAYYRGLALFAYDTVNNGLIVAQCQPNGAGNSHTTVTFDAPSTGVIAFVVFPNVPTEIGQYTLNVRLASEPQPAPAGQRIYLPFLRR